MQSDEEFFRNLIQHHPKNRLGDTEAAFDAFRRCVEAGIGRKRFVDPLSRIAYAAMFEGEDALLSDFFLAMIETREIVKSMESRSNARVLTAARRHLLH
jgi:hypothetical protein